MRVPFAVCLFCLLPLIPACSQAADGAISLAQCVDAALSQGADNRILQKNLDIARERARLLEGGKTRPLTPAQLRKALGF